MVFAVARFDSLDAQAGVAHVLCRNPEKWEKLKEHPTAKKVLEGVELTPTEKKLLQQCYWVAEGVLGGRVLDPTFGATDFCCVEDAMGCKGKRLGSFIFFK